MNCWCILHSSLNNLLHINWLTLYNLSRLHNTSGQQALFTQELVQLPGEHTAVAIRRRHTKQSNAISAYSQPPHLLLGGQWQ